jgi:opacity protein-like surface antigen
MGRVLAIIGMATAVYLNMAFTPLPAYAEEPGRSEGYRKGKWEVLLGPQYTLAKNLGFDGGTTAKIDDTVGFNFQVCYNFNEHWNLGGFFSWSNPDYHAVSQPASGNTSPAHPSNGTLQTNTFAMAVTYHFLKGPLTPYVEANVGGMNVNTDIAAGPPVSGCYWDPWYGNICGVTQPTKSGTFLSYGIGGGLRWDVNSWLLFRGGARQEWVDLSHTGTPSFTVVKIDVGFKF